MASSKREFSNFEKFPGDFIIIDKNRLYVFPEVIYKDSLGRTRSWKIFIRLLESKTGNLPTRGKINWDLHSNSSVNIHKDHYKNVSSTIISQFWTEQGIINGTKDYTITRSIPTYITKGKNLGKINETNVFTQALITARSKYLKQVEQHAADTTDRVFPVAVHKYDAKPKSKERHIVYPCIVQRKLDGGRAVAYFDSKTSLPILYTRKLKNLAGNTHIVESLKQFYKIINKKYPGAYLDGELYKHGLSLQQISGIMRREGGSKTTTREQKQNPNTPQIKLEYHIFDIFFPFVETKVSMHLNERIKILDWVFKQAMENNVDTTYLKLVETFIAKDSKDETLLYDKFLEEKYEGSIVKNMASPYEFGTHREIRSYQMRKRKPRYSDEYEIVGFTEGVQGKDKGAIIFIMKTKGDKVKKIPSIQFNSAPVGIDYEDRYKLFREMTDKKFNSEYKGKMMTVEYDDISEEGVPLRAKAKVVRSID